MKSHAAAVALLSGKRKPRVRKPAKAPVSYAELPCVVLAVDTARKSGWCVRAPKAALPLLDWGTIDIRQHDPDGIVKLAEGAIADCGDLTDRSLVLVLERSWGGRKHQVEGLGAARHAWEAAWRRRGMARSRIVRVYPATWRTAVLGTTCGDLERLELATASRLAGVNITDRDEAAAICLAEYASRAAAVAAVLPKERKRA